MTSRTTLRSVEAYKLDCFGCGDTVELPAGKAGTPVLLTCPQCGARLEVDWRGHGLETGRAES